MRGLLSSSSNRVSIVRLTRTPNGGSAHHLKNEKLTQLWQNPILQFSDVLSGIFHDGVIVTESDADCRFYSAMSGATVKAEDRTDLHYVYAGGKDRIAVIVAALVGLHVPIVSVLDFDVLNNEMPLRNIVEAYGANWNSLEADWKIVKTAVESKSSFLGAGEFKRQATDVLGRIPVDGAVSRTDLSEIRKLTRRASPWDQIKVSGLSALPSGDVTLAAKRLLTNLRSIGIFVVPCGEMEGFCRDIGGHGPRWVEQVLERSLIDDDDLNDARKFVHAINGHFKNALNL